MKKLRRKAVFWCANIPSQGQLEWQRLKFLSRWKYPQQSLRLCHTFLNQTQTQQTATKKWQKKPQILIAVAEGGEGKNSPAFLKPRCGEQKGLAWDIPVPWVLSLPSSSFTKQFREGGKGSLIYIFYRQLIWRFVFVWNKETICLAPNTAAAWSNLSLSCSGPFGQEANIQLIPCAG